MATAFASMDRLQLRCLPSACPDLLSRLLGGDPYARRSGLPCTGTVSACEELARWTPVGACNSCVPRERSYRTRGRFTPGEEVRSCSVVAIFGELPDRPSFLSQGLAFSTLLQAPYCHPTKQVQYISGDQLLGQLREYEAFLKSQFELMLEHQAYRRRLTTAERQECRMTLHLEVLDERRDRSVPLPWYETAR